jgi:hypothetical protein
MVPISIKGIKAKYTMPLFKFWACVSLRPAAVLVHIAHCANALIFAIKIKNNIEKFFFIFVNLNKLKL